MTADPATRRSGSVPAPVGYVVFDMDGVLADTEHLWDEAWTTCAHDLGAPWGRENTVTLQGMSSPEWSAALARHVRDHSDHVGGAAATADGVLARCVGHVLDAVRAGRGPLLPGARGLLEDAAARVPVGLASSAAPEVIEAVLRHHGIGELFTTTVSSAQVARGKPSPDVYREALRRLGHHPTPAGRRPAGTATDRAGTATDQAGTASDRAGTATDQARAASDRAGAVTTGPSDTAPGGPVGTLAVEDSANGIRAAHAAGMRVIALPNPDYPPASDAVRLAEYVATDHEDAARQLRATLDGRAAHPPPGGPAPPGVP